LNEIKETTSKSEGVLGLIAGGGKLPFLVAEGAKKAGLKVICVGLGETAEGLSPGPEAGCEN